MSNRKRSRSPAQSSDLDDQRPAKRVRHKSSKHSSNSTSNTSNTNSDTDSNTNNNVNENNSNGSNTSITFTTSHDTLDWPRFEAKHLGYKSIAYGLSSRGRGYYKLLEMHNAQDVNCANGREKQGVFHNLWNTLKCCKSVSIYEKYYDAVYNKWKIVYDRKEREKKKKKENISRNS